MARSKGSSSKGSAAKGSRDKGAKFVELGQKRVSAAIHKIRLVRNLANRASYDFNKQQVDALIRALTEEVETLEARFVAALEAPSATKEAAPAFSFETVK